jgi:hypothetical protein
MRGTGRPKAPADGQCGAMRAGGAQLRHGPAHRGFAELLMRVPVGLAAVGAEALEEFHRLRGPPRESHAPQLKRESQEGRRPRGSAGYNALQPRVPVRARLSGAGPAVPPRSGHSAVLDPAISGTDHHRPDNAIGHRTWTTCPRTKTPAISDWCERASAELCFTPCQRIVTLNNWVAVSRNFLLVCGCVDKLRAGTGD